MTYQEVIKKVKELFEEAKVATLATCNRYGIISCSQVCIVNEGMTLYFQTAQSFDKVKNIYDNPNVGISCNNYNFKGTATILGHPAQNQWFIEKYKTKYPVAYEKFTNNSDEVLIKVVLNELKMWQIPDGITHHDEVLTVINLSSGAIKEYKSTKN